MEETVQFRLNNKPVKLTMDRDRKLLWVLRTDLGLTRVKYGCGESYCGYCGSCTILVNDRAVRSCQTALKDVQGKEITTLEGLAQNDKLHPLQKAFILHRVEASRRSSRLAP